MGKSKLSSRNPFGLVHVLFLWLCWYMVLPANAQNYPIYLHLNINKPHQINLNVWKKENTALELKALNKDAVSTEIAVYFKIAIEGMGVSIQSFEDFKPSFSTSLQYGIPSFISGVDMAQMLSIENLNIEGLDEQDFANRSLQLPEGFYTVSISAFEYATDLQVSNTAFSSIYTFQQQPPIILSPSSQSEIKLNATSFMLISWLPRHTIGNNSHEIVYKLKIFELPEDFLDPNDAVQNTEIPLIEVVVSETQYLLSPANSPLRPNRHFALQVQAVDLSGETYFINEGKSETQFFSVIDDCPIPIVEFTQCTDSLCTISVIPSIWSDSYTIEWTNPKSQTTEFVESKSSTFSIPNTSTSFRLKSKCAEVFSELSPVYLMKQE